MNIVAKLIEYIVSGNHFSLNILPGMLTMFSHLVNSKCNEGSIVFLSKRIYIVAK